ncbi:Transmembrane and TPR repeat-containing protein 4 [Holothuria leucospilota]|uniref:Transmembrane and TPR repeat-containing protein 4 n=1 Tax=Holothuria leucospilota TaxID=206669 RepID=A0A9Q1BQ43_HOLLE|nr:Transmembrane and TPR repeat-containing protein 4 [Holothuria leucospilota]
MVPFLSTFTGKLDAAVEVARRALKYLPNEPGIHFILGNVLGKSDRLEEAESSFLRALALDPNMGSYHANIGVLYHRWNKFTQAEYHYQKALEINPSDSATLENVQKLKRVQSKQQRSKQTI